MADQIRKARPDDGEADARDTVEENAAQRQSDAAPDAVGERGGIESTDRADGGGSDANGTPAFDEADGEKRRKLYENGATLVSRID